MAGGNDYAGKPRPVVVLQDDRFDSTESITFCAFTSDPVERPLFRPFSTPDDVNGLRRESQLMVDKITTCPKTKLGQRIGRLSEQDMVRVNRAVAVFLGLAGGATR